MPVVVFTNNLIEEAVGKNEVVVVCTDNRDLQIRTTTSTRFDLTFFRVLSKKDTPEFFIVLFSTRKDSTVIV